MPRPLLILAINLALLAAVTGAVLLATNREQRPARDREVGPPAERLRLPSGEDWDAAWAFRASEGTYLVVVLGSVIAKEPVPVAANEDGSADAEKRQWSCKRAGRVAVYLCDDRDADLGPIKLEKFGCLEEIPVATIEQEPPSTYVVPHARRHGRECSAFARAAIKALGTDNGFLRFHLSQTLGRLGRWGRSESVRAFWADPNDDRAEFLARFLRWAVVGYGAPFERQAQFCARYRRLSLEQANLVVSVVERRAVRIAQELRPLDLLGTDPRIDELVNRVWREDVARLRKVVEPSFAEHFLREASFGSWVPDQAMKPTGKSRFPIRIVAPRPESAKDSGTGDAVQKGGKHKTDAEWKWKHLQGGRGFVMDRAVARDGDRIYINIAAPVHVSDWQVATKDGQSIPYKAEHREAAGLVTLEVELPAESPGALMVSGKGLGTREVLVSRYSDAEEVQAFSRLGLQFIASPDPLIRQEARRFINLGNTAEYHRARRAAEGEMRRVLERIPVGARAMRWNVEELAAQIDLTLEQANDVYEDALPYLRRKATLADVKETLLFRRRLSLDDTAATIESLQGRVDRVPR